MQKMKNNDDFLRELIHKSWHRGCKETDILLGFFARDTLGAMDAIFLEKYSKFIYESDWDIYAWLTEEAKSPEKYRDIIKKIQDYHSNVRALNLQ